jgi:hypothetical protein
MGEIETGKMEAMHGSARQWTYHPGLVSAHTGETGICALHRAANSIRYAERDATPVRQNLMAM